MPAGETCCTALAWLQQHYISARTQKDIFAEAQTIKHTDRHSCRRGLLKYNKLAVQFYRACVQGLAGQGGRER